VVKNETEFAQRHITNTLTDSAHAFFSTFVTKRRGVKKHDHSRPWKELGRLERVLQGPAMCPSVHRGGLHQIPLSFHIHKSRRSSNWFTEVC